MSSHGKITKTQAEELLMKDGREGTFLVRDSTTKEGDFALSIVYSTDIAHYRICKYQNDIFSIDGQTKIKGLDAFIEYYQRNQGGLITPLRRCIPPPPPTRLRQKNEHLYVNHCIRRSKSPSHFLGPSRVINISDIDIKQELGKGEFATVYSADLKLGNDFECKKFQVAVKKLKVEKADEYRASFMQEFTVLMELKHQNIIRLLGIVTTPVLMIVQELMTKGSLLDFLEESKKKNIKLPSVAIKTWAYQIACGMSYLVSKQFVHRDLAARNILLSIDNCCKIADFGLSRMFAEDKEYYRAKKIGLWPVPWYAPEIYRTLRFSHSSDVWSYGILLYEMYSYGKRPYGDKLHQEIIEFVDEGGRLEQPSACPSDVYRKMHECWNADPRERPTFDDLKEFFE